MSTSLFVTDEDGDTDMTERAVEESQPDIDEEDPIVQEIPINLTQGPCPLHVLQFPNKPKKLNKTMHDHPVVGDVRFKEKSSLWELDIPLNTEVFFDKEKANETWDNVDIQTLRGVAVPKNETQYVGIMSQGQIYLLPIEKVAQMRPHFSYIDQHQLSRRDDESRNKSSTSQPVKGQVVTMSVKSSSEANQNRLGGSLLAHKVADEEEATHLQWKDDTFDAFLMEVASDESAKPLVPVDDSSAYLSKLL